MATELEPRKAVSKNDAHLERTLAELCARIRRSDLVFNALLVVLLVASYAFALGLFDFLVGQSTATWVSTIRWAAYVILLVLVTGLLFGLSRSALRRVNPYFVAHQLEQTLPGAKNSLINWLDMRSKELPGAFRKNLSADAAKQLNACDSRPVLRNRKNRVLLVLLALPAFGLLVLLLLGPASLISSLRRAFVPFVEGPLATRTRITMVNPAAGETETTLALPMTLSAQIEGHVPAGSHPNAPRLLYRYEGDEVFLSQALREEGGVWTTELVPEQIRTGFSYRITAGDAATPIYPVRIRGRAHVKQFEVTYLPRPSRKLVRTTSVFPNSNATAPFIRGPRGTDVELVIRASRPVQKARVEFLATNVWTQVPVRMRPDEPAAFDCRLTLEQSGKFRVLFTSVDGEQNVDQAPYLIEVPDDPLPHIVITAPAKDTSLAENGTLELAGRAASDIGVKNVTLRLRVASGPDKGREHFKAFRPDKSFRFDDGTYPDVIEYEDLIALDQLKDQKGAIVMQSPGTVLEYWLEANDAADFPDPKGNLARSAVYKVTLLPKSKDAAQQLSQRKKVEAQQNKSKKEQDERLSKQNADRNQKAGPGAVSDPTRQAENLEKDLAGPKEQIKKALQEPGDDKQKGNSKSAEESHAESKPGPGENSEGTDAQSKNEQTDSPAAGGNNKGQGQGTGGEVKGSGDPQSGPDNPGSAGAPKAGGPVASSPAKDAGSGEKQPGGASKKESAGEAKGSSPNGANQPDPHPSRENGSAPGAPKPSAKSGMPPPANAPPAPGDAKGVEREGPEVPNKDREVANADATAQAKPGTMADSTSEPKAAAPEQAKDAGNARGEGSGGRKQEPTWDELANLVEKLSAPGAAGGAAAKALADLGKQAPDERMRDLAKEVLAKDDRDPGTGKPLEAKADAAKEANKTPAAKAKKGSNTSPKDTDTDKGPNLYGSLGKSGGVGDDVKAAVANREFVRRIGQMQLDDWKKRMSAQVLLKAGLSEADWQRFLKDMQAYDSLVRRLNASKLKATDQRGNPASVGSAPRAVAGADTSNDPLGAGFLRPPPDLRDAQRRFTTSPKEP